MIKISELYYPSDIPVTNEELILRAAKKLSITPEDILSIEILKKSLDARKKWDIHYIFTVAVSVKEHCRIRLPKEAEIFKPEPVLSFSKADGIKPPVIVGFGPAGIFCGLVLALSGAKPVILERGDRIPKRTEEVADFWEKGTLNTECNVQFGEGGAGTFSDGKLSTGTKSPYHRFILETLVQHGAPREILYESKSHIGTDKLGSAIISIRKKIEELGGRVIFGARLSDIYTNGKTKGALSGVSYVKDGESFDIEAENLILAIGHSARDTYELLCAKGIRMEQKPFSLGLRIEHLQQDIDKAMYGVNSGLPPASYKLAEKIDGRGVYSFCMCPGGQVIQSASEAFGVVTNGMSRHARDGKNANSAILVSVVPEDYPGNNPLAGIKLQRKIENAAYKAAGGDFCAPVFSAGDFLKKNQKGSLGEIIPSIKPGYSIVPPEEYLPPFVVRGLREALPYFDKKIRGFASPFAVLTGPETRSSSPLRIIRDEYGHSPSMKGLYPVGEGAGYAGGIISSAADGIKAAVGIINGRISG